MVVSGIVGATICASSAGILCPVAAAMVGGYLGSQFANSIIFEVVPGLLPERNLGPMP